MGFNKVAQVRDLPAGAMLDATIGEKSYVVCNVGGEFHAMDGQCPHPGGPLGQGGLHGTTVVCPWHAWEFDWVSGRHDSNPALRLQTFPVKAHGADVVGEV